MDCSEANGWIDASIMLIKKIDDFLWLYVFVWGVVLVRKIFYA